MDYKISYGGVTTTITVEDEPRTITLRKNGFSIGDNNLTARGFVGGVLVSTFFMVLIAFVITITR